MVAFWRYCRYILHYYVIQVLFTDDFIDQLLDELSELTTCDEVSR